MDLESFILHELSDDELDNLTPDEILEIGTYYQEHSLPLESTIKGLLKKNNFKYDDLPKWVQNTNVGICNSINRTDNQIYLSRQGSPKRDNITINLNEGRHVPYMTIQLQIGDYFIHEEAYDEEGNLLYRT